MALSLDLLRKLLAKLFFLRLLRGLLRGGGRGEDFLPKPWLEARCWLCILRSPMSSTASRKCLCCNDMFPPDARNRRHQQYCAKDACRKASKAARQARWLAKPENRDYFRGSANCERVRQWRLANPGYSRGMTAARPGALQDVLNPQSVENETSVQSCTPSPLQDVLLLQPALIVGLIAVMTGHDVQDDIATTVRFYINRGQDILRMVPGSPEFHRHEKQITPVSGTPATRAPPIQLDRPTPGA
jgi:hypothetical protein